MPPENDLSFESLKAIEVTPSFEELLAAQSAEGSEPKAEPTGGESEFPFWELAARDVRQVAKGATLGASEIPMGYLTAAGGVASDIVADLYKQGKLDEAKTYLDNLEAYYEADWKRQKEFAEKVPGATGLEIAGGFIPGSPAIKAATLGMKEGAKFLGRMGQAAVSGATGLGAYTAAEVAARPASMRKGIGEEAKEIAFGTAAGAVAGPAISGLVEGIVKSPQLLTSAPVLRTVSLLLGPPVPVLKAYASRVKEITELPSVEQVTSFFDDVRGRLIQQAEKSDFDLAAAKENVANLRDAFEKAETKATQAERAKLAEAKLSLDKIEEDLKFELSQEVRPEYERAAAQQKEAFKEAEAGRKQAFREKEAERRQAAQTPQMGPHVETVNNALQVVKQEIVDQSAAARQLIRDDVFFNTNDIIGFWQQEARKLRVKGTETAKGETAEKAINVIARQVKRLNEMPPRITGDQLKDLLQGYDKDIADSMLRPGQFGEVYDNAIKAVRKQMDEQLKGANPEYRKALEPVNELQDVLKNSLKEFGGGQPGPIESKLRQAIDNPRVYEVFQKLEEKSKIPVLNVVKEGQKNKEILKEVQPLFRPGTPPNPKTLPEYQAVKNIQAQIALKKAKDFEREAFKAIKNTEVAQEIIALRDQINTLKNPEYGRARIEEAVREQRISLEEAEAALAGIERQREEASKYMNALINKSITKGEDLMQKILRVADRPKEAAEATKIIQAITELPPQQFSDLMDDILLTNPQEAQKLFRNLRVDYAMDKARINGSRSTNVYRAIFSGLFGAGAGAAGGIGTSATMAAFGALFGYYKDEYGGQLAKAYLRNAAKMQGIPTIKKFMGLAPGAASPAMRNQAIIQLSDMAAATDKDALYTVSEAFKPAVERDIKMSKMSALDRAKALNELNSLGGVSGKYIRKIMLDSAPPATPMVQQPVRESLEADKPDMLQRLSKRAAKQEEASLASYVRSMS